VDVLASTFNGYDRDVVDVEGGEVLVEGVTATSTGGTVVRCAGSRLTLRELTVDQVVGWTSIVEHYSGTSLLATDTEARQDPALDATSCEIVGEDLVVGDVVAEAMVVRDGVTELENARFERVATGDTGAVAALDVAWSDRAPGLVLDDVIVADVDYGSGVSVDVAAGLEPGYVELLDVVVQRVPGSGLLLGGGTHRLSGVTVEDADLYGMSCDVTEPPVFAACDVTLEGALGPARDCSGCP
jgi:hypothetical protein